MAPHLFPQRRLFLLTFLLIVSSHRRHWTWSFVATYPRAAVSRHWHLPSSSPLISSSHRRRNQQNISVETTKSNGLFHRQTVSSMMVLSLSSSPSSSQQDPAKSDNNNDDSDDDDSENENKVDYDGLYEFLTRRTGEQAGESERLRKRNRIMEWMNSSNNESGNNNKDDNSSSSSGGSNLVQPIRMQDGKVDEDLLSQQQQQQQSRTRAKFDQLFAGMPSLDNILSGDGTTTSTNNDKEEGPSDGTSSRSDESRRPRARVDDSWFDEERKEIELEYEQILQKAKEQVQQQRRDEESAHGGSNEESSIPENAEGIVESIVKQELERMLASVKTARGEERLRDYHRSQMSDMNARDYTDMVDDVVERMLKEAAEDTDRREKLQAQADEFFEYERQQQRVNSDGSTDNTKVDASSSMSLPSNDSNLDDWALDRLEDMLKASQNLADDAGAIGDILEDNIQDLRRRIDKESQRGTIKPQTMKEWQMYRAIATRLGRQQGEDEDSDVAANRKDVDEEVVSQQLNSWREYVEKEEGIRRKAGLSSGPKLPFEELGRKGDISRIEYTPTDTVTSKKSRRELRREVNIQAVQAIEDLIRKSDSARAAGLQRELDALKAELEPRDYNDIEEEAEEDQALAGPVDLSNVFDRSEEKDNRERAGISSSGLSPSEVAGVSEILSGAVSSGYDGISGSFSPPARQVPPKTPFFAKDSIDDLPIASAPETPFFQEASRNSKEDLDIDNKLGSVEEQKLQAMFRRSGARTKQEQDAIRREWEAFQEFEKQSRDKSGLSEGADDLTFTGEANMKYDISEVIKEDGDFDADKILSTIGPRPTKSSGDKKESGLSSAGVADSLYRSVAAAGGGRGKEDKVYQEKDRAEFNDYLAKEEEMRKSLDDADINAAKVAKSLDISDDQSYAEDVLAASPRPIFKRKRRVAIDERELSDRGGVLASEDDNDGHEDDDDDDDDMRESIPIESDLAVIDDLVPGWLKKEREAVAKTKSGDGFLGSDIDETFSDDQYEHNLRQLHEYEQRRSGGKQMGIDISDIFGRRGSDDYVDYTYDTDYFRGREDGWGASSFEARKENLLQYIELDTAELNNLIAYKESTYATGVSQYLPRINKPFREFGAIFRLEGVLVDISGLQLKVWERVANEFAFKDPLLEDIHRAAVTRPEVVVKEVFFGTNDVFLVRQVVDAYRRILREEFDRWATENGVVVREEPSAERQASPSEKGSLALGFEDIQDRQHFSPPHPDEGARLRHLKETWTNTAKQFGYSPPTDKEIAETSMVTPDIAVRSIFGWATDQMQIDQVVAAYSIMQAGDQSSAGSHQELVLVSPSTSEESRELNEATVLELQFLAWKKVADENGLLVPDPEKVLAAAVLNDPEAVVVDGFGWTANASDAQKYGSLYREYLAKLVNDRLKNPSLAEALTSKKPIETASMTTTEQSAAQGPTDEEVVGSQVEAWKEAATVHSFDAPPVDRIQMVMNMNAADAVRQLIQMDYNIDDLTLQEVTNTYSEALRKASLKYLQRYNLSPEVQSPSTTIRSNGAKKSTDVSEDDIYRAAFDAWTNIAWKEGFSVPDQEQVLFAMTVGPYEAILASFQWTDDTEEAERITKMYLDQIKLKRDDWHKKGYTTTVQIETSRGMDTKEQRPLVQVLPDVTEWIASLRAVEMGCSVVSYLEDDQMAALLNHAGLADLFPRDVRVSHSNGYDRDSQQLLGAALRMERRPDHCVLFDTTPYACGAAHEVDMRSVALVGPYPRYELLAADTSAVSFDELTAMNIRRLFGERVYDQPMLDQQSTQPDSTKRIKTAYEWDED